MLTYLLNYIIKEYGLLVINLKLKFMYSVTAVIIIALISVIIGDLWKIKILIPIGTSVLFGFAMTFSLLYSQNDYNLELNPQGTIEISDKYNNIQIIELDSLEEFIIKDNL